MPRKRKSETIPEPTITVTRAEPPKTTPVRAYAPPVELPVRCIWDSKLVVGANRTPSGRRYVFMPDEVQMVAEIDYQFLLRLQTKTPGCCGGAGGSSVASIQKYFIEV